MSIKLPTMDDIRTINIDVIQNSTDPNEDASDAGKFLNERYLNDALNPCYEYQTVFEAAYGLAYAIAGLHVFLNGNKRTAKQTVIETFKGNNLNFNGNDTELLELVNSLVDVDGDKYEEVKENFIRGISELFA